MKLPDLDNREFIPLPGDPTQPRYPACEPGRRPARGARLAGPPYNLLPL